MDVVLIGFIDNKTLDPEDGDHVFGSRYIASRSGTLTSLMFYAKQSGNVKVGVYSDDGNLVDARLAKQDISTPVIMDQWNEIPLDTPLNVNAGIPYWLLINSDVADIIWRAYDPVTSWSFKDTYVSFESFVYPESWNYMSGYGTYRTPIYGIGSSLSGNLLLGMDSVGSAIGESKDIVFLSPYMVQYSGSLQVVQLYAGTTGNVKIAVYSDNIGLIGNLLATQKGIEVAVIKGLWNLIELNRVNTVKKGDVLWIGAIADENYLITVNVESGSRAYKTALYSSFMWPETFVAENYLTDETFNYGGFGPANKFKLCGIENPSRIMGIDVANITKVMGI